MLGSTLSKKNTDYDTDMVVERTQLNCVRRDCALCASNACGMFLDFKEVWRFHLIVNHKGVRIHFWAVRKSMVIYWKGRGFNFDPRTASVWNLPENNS